MGSTLPLAVEESIMTAPRSTRQNITRRVHWYHCNCDVLSKYCDEYHRSVALVPAEVLRKYTVNFSD